MSFQCRCCDMPIPGSLKRKTYCHRCDKLTHSGLPYYEICEMLANSSGKHSGYYLKKSEEKFDQYLAKSADAKREIEIRNQIKALRTAMKEVWRADCYTIDGQKRKIYRCPECGKAYENRQCLPCEWKIKRIIK